MTNKLLIVMVALAAVVGLGGCSAPPSSPPSSSANISQVTSEVNDHQLISIEVNGKKLSVEAVMTPESITQGLGDRESIGSDGMLFFLPSRQIAQFWMHGMKFPLDFVWIDGTNIVGLEKNVPAPADPSSMKLPSYSSKVPVTQVLELYAGKADELGLAPTMSIKYVTQ